MMIAKVTSLGCAASRTGNRVLIVLKWHTGTISEWISVNNNYSQLSRDIEVVRETVARWPNSHRFDTPG